MKKLVLIILFFYTCILSYSQTIKGVVLDNETNEKVCFATVYFDNTFIGTTSDAEGKFSLHVPDNSNMSIVVSSIGYYSASISKYSEKDSLIIFLTPKAYKIQEVNILEKLLVRKRKKYLRIFKKQFLGNTENGTKCAITNEKDISFNYHTSSDTIKAYALKPIEIDNNALGYKILFYLDKFEFYKETQSFYYKGHIIYLKDMMIESNCVNNFLKVRKDTYLGSRMHFFRSLWLNDLTRNGFLLSNADGSIVKYEEFVHKESSKYTSSKEIRRKYLSYSKQLTIFRQHTVSKLNITGSKVYFDKRGYYDIGLFWKGEMAFKRIGDKLPLEYELP